MKTMTKPTEVFALLAAQGISASWEFPGYVHVPLGDYKHLACGTANGPWECDVWAQATGYRPASEATVPFDASPEQVVALIVAAKAKTDGGAA